MRTTITLTPEAELLVHRAMEERRMSFKDVVNEAIIDGLRSGPRETEPYVLPTFDMGEPLVDLTHALRIAGDLEDEEIIRKMRMGK